MNRREPYQIPRYELEPVRPRRLKLYGLIGLIMILIVASFIGYHFFGSEGEDKKLPIPLIKAAEGPTKVLPDSSEQPEVPHQDKLIYSRVNPDESVPQVENLLEESEQPLDPKELTQGGSQDLTPQDLISGLNEFEKEEEAAAVKAQETDLVESTALQDNFPQLAESTSVQEKPTVAKPQETSTEAVKERDRIQAVSETPKSAPAQVAAEKVLPKAQKLKSGFRIQVASLKTPHLAEKEWQRLKYEYAGILNGLYPHYARVDLGAKKGIFYRVQVGDFKNKVSAEDVCKKMKTKNQGAGCIVIPF